MINGIRKVLRLQAEGSVLWCGCDGERQTGHAARSTLQPSADQATKQRTHHSYLSVRPFAGQKVASVQLWDRVGTRKRTK